jgi:hypothetical protein
VLTQCAVEEALGLSLAMKGLTSYAETLSVYGTERSFLDGDDTPWSKAFLASAYASRGVKVRFTSGSGSEALMGLADGCSMLYLEARCLLITRGAGSQGVQNGSISCIALPESLPGGVRVVLAENLLASMLGILHHQRPGFLSFPSSHLIPYNVRRKLDHPVSLDERPWGERNDVDAAATASWGVSGEGGPGSTARGTNHQ